MVYIKLFNLAIVIILILQEPHLTNADFCERAEREEELFDCPNLANFNILNELNKPNGTWKLDFSKFGTNNVNEILRQIKFRLDSYQKCPYVRITANRECCPGYTGVSCAVHISYQASMTHSPIAVKRTTTFATCSLWGIDHFRTFDGLEFSFSGKCEYKVAGNNDWVIHMEPLNCFRWETCQKKLVMIFERESITAIGNNITHGSRIINGKYSFGLPSNALIEIDRKDSYWYLKYSGGVRLRWNNDTWVFVSLESNFKEKTSGICGDFNDVLNDDLRLPNNQVALNSDEFGNAWRLDSQCPLANTTNPCTSLAITQAAEQVCRHMLESRWQDCSSTEAYYNCIWDFCLAVNASSSVQVATCSSYEALSRKCVENGVTVSWRNSTFCPKKCPLNRVYTECASHCQKTCINRNQDSPQLCNQECTGGCVCPAGTFIDTGRQNQCVQPKDCKCFYKNSYYDPNSTISVDCNRCSCVDGFWNCTRNRCPRSCSVLGMGHYKTFDGNTFNFIGSCDYYTLVDDYVTKTLKIEYTNRQLISSSNRFLRVTYLSNVVVLVNNTFTHNNVTIARLPFITNDITVRRQESDFWIVRVNGARVLFDGIRVYVDLRRNYEGKVRGLCGTFTYQSSDDYQMPNGMIDSNVSSFARAYSDESTCPGSVTTSDCKSALNREPCERLRNFTCDIDPENYIAMCLKDLCLDLNAEYQVRFRCRAFAAYAYECARIGSPLANWLSVLDCASSEYGRCSGNRTYSDCINECNSTCTSLSLRNSACETQCVPGCACGSSTPLLDENTNRCVPRSNCSCYDKGRFIQPNVTLADCCSNCTCSNGSIACTYRNPISIRCPASQQFSFNASRCPRTCENYPDYRDCGIYVSGCRCPANQVLFNMTTCVPVEQCPCKQGDTYYPPGFVLNRECQACTCLSGFWSCVRRPCDGICRATGDPHYITFDNNAYSFQGDCKYVLVTTHDGSLQIIAENVKCAADGSTCTKSVEIIYSNYTIIARRGMETFVNGRRIEFFFQAQFFSPDLVISKQGVLQVIRATDFEVRWDGAQNVYIIAKEALKGRVRGLCGNYNGDKQDDLTTQTNATESNWNVVAHSWRVDSTCTLPAPPRPACSGTEYRRKWAEEKCGILTNTSLGAPFRDCNRYLSKEELDRQYDNCLYDACNCNSGDDCSCLCSTFSQFAEYCKQLNYLVNWRSNEICPIQCEGDLKYNVCGPLCQPTCFDNSTLTCSNTTTCFEGCFCPPGTYLDHKNRCLTDSAQCPCLDTKTGQVYENGAIFASDNCTLCECKAGKLCCALVEQCRCKQDEFTCNDQLKCIKQEWICDGEDDCDDLSDELNCTCRKNEFTCKNGECVPLLFKCDGKSDCVDGSDEFDCTNETCIDGFKCKNGKCIPIHFRCDGENDCGDISDELDCVTTTQPNDCDPRLNLTRCRNSYECIPNSLICDGHIDCIDGSDEQNCIAPVVTVICAANILNFSNFSVVIPENIRVVQLLRPFTFNSTSNFTLTIGVANHSYHNVSISAGLNAVYDHLNVTFLNENMQATSDFNGQTAIEFQTPQSETSTIFVDERRVFFLRIVFRPVNGQVTNIELAINACMKPIVHQTTTLPTVITTSSATVSATSRVSTLSSTLSPSSASTASTHSTGSVVSTHSTRSTASTHSTGSTASTASTHSTGSVVSTHSTRSTASTHSTGSTASTASTHSTGSVVSTHSTRSTASTHSTGSIVSGSSTASTGLTVSTSATATSTATQRSSTLTTRPLTTSGSECNTELNDTLVSEVTTIPVSKNPFLTEIYQNFNGEILPVGTVINITLIGVIRVTRVGIPNNNSNVRQISVRFYDRLNNTIILPDNSSDVLSALNGPPIITSNLPIVPAKYIIITIRSLINPLLNATVKITLVGCFERSDFTLIPGSTTNIATSTLLTPVSTTRLSSQTSTSTTISSSSTRSITSLNPTTPHDIDENSTVCVFNQTNVNVNTDVKLVNSLNQTLALVLDMYPSGTGIELEINETIIVQLRSEFRLVFLKEVGLTFTDPIRRITGIEVRLTDLQNVTQVFTNANVSSNFAVIMRNLPSTAISLIVIRVTNVSGGVGMVQNVKLTIRGCYTQNVTSTTRFTTQTTSLTSTTATTRGISTTSCPVGNWSSWSECDRSCGPGTITRIRYIIENGTCQTQIESLPCIVANCTCAITTDLITRFNITFINAQLREIGYIEKDGLQGFTSVNESVRVGDTVVSSQIIFLLNCLALKCLENGTLELNTYFENFVLTNWTEWSSCVGLCGPGRRNRTRECKVPKCLSNFSRPCNESLIEFGDCECSSTLTSTTLRISSTSLPATSTTARIITTGDIATVLSRTTSGITINRESTSVSTTSATTTRNGCILSNGTFIENGQSTFNTSDPCLVCDCSAGILTCKRITCNETEGSCRNKSNDNAIYEWIPASSGTCCGECRLRFNLTCTVTRLPDAIVSFNSSCRSTRPLQREECFGTCFSSHQSFIQNGASNRLCRCCTPNLVTQEDIQVDCDNGRRVAARYNRIISCTCQECHAVTSNRRYPSY